MAHLGELADEPVDAPGPGEMHGDDVLVDHPIRRVEGQAIRIDRRAGFIDDQVVQRFATVLGDKDINYIYKSISHVPGWMADTIHKIKQLHNGQIHNANGAR